MILTVINQLSITIKQTHHDAPKGKNSVITSEGKGEDSTHNLKNPAVKSTKKLRSHRTEYLVINIRPDLRNNHRHNDKTTPESQNRNQQGVPST